MTEELNVRRNPAVNADLFWLKISSQERDVKRAAVNNQQDRHHSLRQTACLTVSTKTEGHCVGLSGRLSADSLSNTIHAECMMTYSLFFIIFIWNVLSYSPITEKKVTRDTFPLLVIIVVIFSIH